VVEIRHASTVLSARAAARTRRRRQFHHNAFDAPHRRTRRRQRKVTAHAHLCRSRPLAADCRRPTMATLRVPYGTGRMTNAFTAGMEDFSRSPMAGARTRLSNDDGYPLRRARRIAATVCVSRRRLSPDRLPLPQHGTLARDSGGYVKTPSPSPNSSERRSIKRVSRCGRMYSIRCNS
jgi:hypothetical protein